MTGRAALRLIVVLLAGLCFGFGLSVSGMVNPGRVLGFLDVASGHWDPSLMVVLAGAVMVTIPGVLLQRRLSHPVLDQRFHLPQNCVIDRRLLVGSAIFGAGWGLAGFCPGPAVASLVIGSGPIVLFVTTMLVGMIAHDRFVGRRSA